MASKKKAEPLFQVPATITKIGTMADRSFRLQVDTERELAPAEATLLFSLNSQSGFFLFKGTEFVQSDLENIPDYKPEMKEEKSPSQRLRAVLYRLWEQSGKIGDFELFYKTRMDRLIDQIKEKLT